MPWEERPQKNVYLASHHLGFPGTGSRLVFYNLDKLSNGDSIVLKDSLGIPYEYQLLRHLYGRVCKGSEQSGSVQGFQAY